MFGLPSLPKNCHICRASHETFKNNARRTRPNSRTAKMLRASLGMSVFKLKICRKLWFSMVFPSSPVSRYRLLEVHILIPRADLGLFFEVTVLKEWIRTAGKLRRILNCYAAMWSDHIGPTSNWWDVIALVDLRNQAPSVLTPLQSSGVVC